MKKHKILLSFGGNLPSEAGSPQATIRAAIDALTERGCDPVSVSRFFATRAVTLDGAEIVPDFTNAAALMETALAPDALLAQLHSVEASFGRTRGARWSARTLDIDLLAYDNLVLPGRAAWQKLVDSEDPAIFLREPMVPHPRLHLRGFVLAPLLDVAPEWVHPVLKQSVKGMCAEIESKAGFDDVVEISAGIRA